ncbi:hypothetical protein LPUS_07910 [Lasallia pustulata]|nr:hypothetical protein LPUS_07910 [Lasallia pustulata]
MLNVQIAEASQRDNAAIKAIAEDSKMVALTTSRDSAVMRTITAVTILFLPATFTTVHWPALPVIFYTSAAAAILSNIPEANTRALAHRPFTTVKPPTPTLSFPTGWLYWVVTIALTFLIQADWYFTTKRRGRQFTRDFCRRDHELYVLSNGF